MILHIIMLDIMAYLNVGVAQSNNDIAYNNVRHNALFECRCSSIK